MSRPQFGGLSERPKDAASRRGEIQEANTEDLYVEPGSTHGTQAFASTDEDERKFIEFASVPIRENFTREGNVRINCWDSDGMPSDSTWQIIIPFHEPVSFDPPLEVPPNHTTNVVARNESADTINYAHSFVYRQEDL